jgi:uncharacterized membrane protein YhiD involved in acid resistance
MLPSIFSMNLSLSFRLAIALALGLIIGLERGWESGESAEGERVAGIGCGD